MSLENAQLQTKKPWTQTANHIMELLDYQKWDEAMLLMRAKTKKDPEVIKEIVKIPFAKFGGDMLLHVVCDFNYYEDDEETCESEEECYSDDEERTQRSTLTRTSKSHRTKAASNKATPPPFALFKILFDAFPDATKARGRDGFLPLHYAARGSAPKEIIEELIKAFPFSLNAQDDYKNFPSGYNHHDQEANAMLQRPVTCWIEQWQDIEKNKRLEDEIQKLEAEVGGLMEQIVDSDKKDKELELKIAKMEKISKRCDTVANGVNCEKMIEDIHEKVICEVENMEQQLLDLADKLVYKYDENDAEREYVKEFNEDIARVYKDVGCTHLELKKELTELKALTVS